MKRFGSRTALVTGAGSGIGASTSLQLAGEGAHVCCADDARHINGIELAVDGGFVL